MSKQRIDFGEKVVLKVSTPAPTPDVPTMGPLDELVAFATFIPRGLYLELLERQYHEKGFVIQEAVAEGLRLFIDSLGTPRQPLPPARLGKILKTNKKLRKQ